MGANRNKLCCCGSGKKVKQCKCKFAMIDSIFPDERTLTEKKVNSFMY